MRCLSILPLLALGLGCITGGRAAVTPFTFVHISDMHIALGATAYDNNLKSAVAEINAMSPRPLVVINTGDMTELGRETDFAQYAADMSGCLVPVKHSPGNHETRWADQSINRYIQHYGSPNVSFLQNGIRFIGFNSAIWLEHHGVCSGDTRRWIVSQLAQDPPGTPAILFCHQPPMYPDNTFFTGDVELWDAIAPYNVIAFLNGHGHSFVSWTVNGVYCHMTTGMMNGSGGYSVYKVTSTGIDVYDKTVGGSSVKVKTLSLAPKKVTVTVTPGGIASGYATYTATVSSAGPTVSRVEWQVDHHDHPTNAWTSITLASGKYTIKAPVAGLVQGRHTMAIRAVDSTGGVWIKVLPLDITAGSLTARRFDADTALQGPAAVDDHRVYMGGWDGSLYAVDRATMAKVWSFPTGGAIITRPDVDADAVYTGSTDTNVYALDKATGHQLWKFPTGGPIQGHPRVAGGTVFVASGDHTLYAIDAKTGAQRWTYPMTGWAQARPAVADGIIYIGAWDNWFYALDAQTGALKWKVQIGKSMNFAPAVTSPCVVNGRVLIACAVASSADPNVLCLDAKTGDRLWGKLIPVSGSSSYSSYGSITSDGYRVYMTGIDGVIHALKLSDGSLLWDSPMSAIAYDCMPTYYQGQVICESMYGGVEGHSAATGKLLWSYKTGAGLQFSWPAIADHVVYQTSMDGTLTAITLPVNLAGDANGDGAVDAKDALAIAQGASGLGTAKIFPEADLAPYPSPSGYGDGRITLEDAARLMRHLAGMDSNPPWQTP